MRKTLFLGYAYALLVSLLFSLYIVVRKFSNSSPAAYTTFVGLGFFIPSAFYAMTLPDFSVLFNPILLLSALVGVLWMSASVFFVIAIDKLGLSRSNQWKNLQGPVGAGLSLLVLAEYQITNVFNVTMAVIAIFISAVLFSIRKKTEKIVDRCGIWYAIIAGVLFGTNSVIQKYVTINISEIQPQQLYFSAFVFLSALVYLRIKEKSFSVFKYTFNKNNLMPLLGGSLYFVASQFSIMANQLIPNSIAFTIIQFNAVWTILIGIFIFKEINFCEHWKRITLGLFFAIVSIFILML